MSLWSRFLRSGRAVYTFSETVEAEARLPEVDNYGSGSTPLFGSQIAGFQGHHKQPWVITLREFENRVHGICKVRQAASETALNRPEHK